MTRAAVATFVAATAVLAAAVLTIIFAPGMAWVPGGALLLFLVAVTVLDLTTMVLVPRDEARRPEG